MAYQPTNPHPYMETIDATVANQFSIQINERSVVTGATIHLYKEPNTADTVLETVVIYTKVSNSDGRGFEVWDPDGIIYAKLKSCLNAGATLSIITSKGQMTRITSIQERTYTFRFHTVDKPNLAVGNEVNIYTNARLDIPLPITPESPVYGGLSDDAVLSYIYTPNDITAKTFLRNGYNYSWTAELLLDEKIYISSGGVVSYSFGDDGDFSLYIPYTSGVLSSINNVKHSLLLELSNVKNDYRYSINKFSASISNEYGGTILIACNETIPPEVLNNLGEAFFYGLYETDIVLTTPKYYFNARSLSTVKINPIPETITTGTWTFKGEYFQNEAVQLAYYQFDLYQNGELIDSSSQQNSRLIQYTFESFMNQSKYEIVLTVVNDENVEAVARQSFYVDYTLLNSTIAPVIESDNTNACIKIDYSNHAEIPGKVSKEGAVSFIDDGIHLTQNETILWDERSDKPLDISSSSTQVIRWHGDHGFQGKIVEVCDSTYPWLSTSVEFDGEKFIAKVGGDVVSELGLYTNTENAQKEQYSYGYYQNCTYDGGTQIKIPISEISTSGVPRVGKWIQTINGEHRKIISYELNADSSFTLFIDRPLLKKLEGCFVTYFENSLYRIEDTCELSDTDILIDNDCVSKYWWLIIINPEGSENRVEIRKSALYTESEV